MIDARKAICLLFSLVCFTEMRSQPGSNCATAIDILAIPYSTPVWNIIPLDPPHTTCGPNPYNSIHACGNMLMDGNDRVYTFTPGIANNCITLQVIMDGNPSVLALDPDAALFVTEGCPDLPASRCVAQGVNEGMGEVRIPDLMLTPGVTYFIIVSGGAACYSYQLNITPGVPSGPGPAGTSCDNPIDIGSFPFRSGPVSTANLGDDFNRGNACENPVMDGNEAVFKLSVNNPACLHFALENISAPATIFITQGCPNSPGWTCLKQISCNPMLCQAIVEELNLPGAGDYYITIASGPLADVEFTLEVNTGFPDDDKNCETCNDAENCASCKNVGFEKLSFNGWAGFTGYYANPDLFPGFSTGPYNNTTSRHTIMTRGNFDPNVNALSCVGPKGKDYSVRLGNQLFNEDAILGNMGTGDSDVLTYTFTVDSSNTNFIYSYAVVLQDPNHIPANQPYFSIMMFTDAGEEIECARYEVRAGQNIPGFISVNNGSLVYKDWSTVNIPLLDFIGRVVTVSFTTKDCNQDGHFGYAYIDARCGILEILRDKDILCNKDSVVLEAPDGFEDYTWSTGAKTRKITVKESGEYTVTMLTVTKCEVKQTVKITKESAPNVNFTYKFNCLDSTVTFTDLSTPAKDSPIISWYWDFGDGDTSNLQNPVHKYKKNGFYSVTLRLSTKNGCDADTTIKFNLDLFIPPGELNTPDTLKVCEKDKVQFTANVIPFTIYRWTGPDQFTSSIRTPILFPVMLEDSGWYYVQARIKDCLDKKDSTYLFVEPRKPLLISPDTLLCEGDSVQLYAAGGVTYRWTPAVGLSNDTIPNPLAKPPVTTRYRVHMTNDLCPDTNLAVNVNILKGNVSLQCPDTLKACEGYPITLKATTLGFNRFSWTGPGGFTSNKASPSIPQLLPTGVGYYYLTATILNNDCLLGYDSIYVDMHPNPAVNTPKPQEVCRGDTIALSATGAVTYSWMPNYMILKNNTATPSVYPQKDTTYFVTGTSPEGCKSRDSVRVIVKPLPVVSLGPDRQLCIGDTSVVKVNISQYDSVRWSDGSAADSIAVTESGLQGITAWKKGCDAKDDLLVNFQDPGNFTLGPDVTLCEGAVYKTMLNRQADSVRWNDGVRTLNRDIAKAGVYWIDLYSGKCLLTDTLVVNFSSKPTLNLPDTSVCQGALVNLSVYNPLALAYHWSTGDTSAVISVSKTGDYWVEIITPLCIITDTVRVTVVDPPLLDLGPDPEICQGDSAQLKSSCAADTYLWTTQETTPVIWVRKPGIYGLLVKTGPCLARDEVALKVQQPLPLSLGPDTALCENQELWIGAPAGFETYFWNNYLTDQVIQVTNSGSYSVIATAGLCSSYDTIEVHFDTIPVFDLGPDRNICAGDSAQLISPVVASNYLWSTLETTRSITVKKEGPYTLFIRNGTCDYEDVVKLVLTYPPVLDIGRDTTVCQGVAVTYGQYIENAVYTWNTKETTPFIQKDTSGLYVLRVDFGVCTVTDEARLTVDPYPDPELGPDVLICEGNTTVFDASNSIGSQYLWNTQEVQRSITVSDPGLYWVQVYNGNCITVDTVILRIQPQHYVMLPPDAEMCDGERLDIWSFTDAKNPLYYWNTNAVTPGISVWKEDTYVLTVTDSVCVARDSITVQVNPLPYLKEQYFLLCPRDSAVLDLPDEYYYIYTANNDTMHTRIVYPDTRLNFRIYDQKGCMWESYITAELDMSCGDDIYVPNAFTPNGDDANDVFKVYAHGLQLHELMIFDRWGELIYTTKSPATGWDGYYNGRKCKTEVYNWKLIYTDSYGVKRTVMGHVSLLK